MITCRELIDFLMDYTDGVLPADQQAEFERHLAVCPDCVAYVGNYRATVALAKAVATGDAALPAEVPEGLVRAILASRRSGG